jgi:hypothetical protein
MPRSKTKEELLFLSHDNYTKLVNYINLLPKNELQNEFLNGYLNRNLRDVLAHLHHWHMMLVAWHTVGTPGAKPDMPAKRLHLENTTRIKLQNTIKV